MLFQLKKIKFRRSNLIFLTQFLWFTSQKKALASVNKQKRINQQTETYSEKLNRLLLTILYHTTDIDKIYNNSFKPENEGHICRDVFDKKCSKFVKNKNE